MLFRPKFIIALLLTLGMLAVGQPESGWTAIQTSGSL